MKRTQQPPSVTAMRQEDQRQRVLALAREYAQRAANATPRPPTPDDFTEAVRGHRFARTFSFPHALLVQRGGGVARIRAIEEVHRARLSAQRRSSVASAEDDDDEVFQQAASMNTERRTSLVGRIDSMPVTARLNASGSPTDSEAPGHGSFNDTNPGTPSSGRGAETAEELPIPSDDVVADAASNALATSGQLAASGQSEREPRRGGRGGALTMDVDSPDEPPRRGLYKHAAAENRVESYMSNVDDLDNIGFYDSVKSLAFKNDANHAELQKYERDAAGFDIINDYVLTDQHPLGKGSFGYVYRAIHERTGDEVAIKIVNWGNQLAKSANVSQAPTAQVTPALTPTLTPVVKELQPMPAGQHLLGESGEMRAPPRVKRPVSGRRHAKRDDDGDANELYHGVPKSISREVAIMKRLQHHRLLQLKEVISYPEEKKLLLVLPLMQGPLLTQTKRGLIQGQSCKSEAQACTIFRQVQSGLRYMHKNGVVHLDIKPGNILLDKDGNACIADFGTARVMDATSCPVGEGTIPFLPPEAFDDDNEVVENAKPFDMWALGITLYMTLFGVHPFQEHITRQCFDAAVGEALRGAQLTFPELKPISAECERVIRRLLHPDPKKRMTVEAFRLSSWIKSSDSTMTSPSAGADSAVPTQTPPTALSLAGGASTVSVPLTPKPEQPHIPSELEGPNTDSPRHFGSPTLDIGSMMENSGNTRPQLDTPVGAAPSFSLLSPTHAEMNDAISDVRAIKCVAPTDLKSRLQSAKASHANLADLDDWVCDE